MSVFPIIIAIALIILVIYFLLNRKAGEQEREGFVKEILKKDAIAVEFGDGHPAVVKLFGISPAAESEMLDEKIYGFFDENIRGTRVLVKPHSVGSGDVMVAEVRTLAGEYVNAVLVRHGFARWTPSEAANDTELAEAQELAKSEKLGVWNPAVQQLVEERRRKLAAEELTDEEISNMTVDPEEQDRREGEP